MKSVVGIGKIAIGLPGGGLVTAADGVAPPLPAVHEGKSQAALTLVAQHTLELDAGEPRTPLGQ